MITLLYGMVFSAFTLCYLLDYARMRIRADQIHTIAELIEMDFRLVGTAAVFGKIREQGTMVCNAQIELNQD